MEKLKCVLLVDDDGVNNYLNRRLLNKLELTYSIESALNGREALEFLDNYSLNNKEFPELILLDLNMPVMDGFEFLDKVKKSAYFSSEKVKIIILTTSLHKRDIETIIKDPNIGYVTKPLTEQKLITLLCPSDKVDIPEK